MNKNLYRECMQAHGWMYSTKPAAVAYMKRFANPDVELNEASLTAIRQVRRECLAAFGFLYDFPSKEAWIAWLEKGQNASDYDQCVRAEIRGEKYTAPNFLHSEALWEEYRALSKEKWDLLRQISDEKGKMASLVILSNCMPKVPTSDDASDDAKAAAAKVDKGGNPGAEGVAEMTGIVTQHRNEVKCIKDHLVKTQHE